MRHDVTTPSYLFRKAVDNILEALTSSSPSPPFLSATDGAADTADLTYTAPRGEDGTETAFAPEPFGWLPLYSMVTFSPHLGYAAARRRAQRQAKVLGTLERIVVLGTAAAVGWTAWSMRARLRWA
jgi:kynurenine 3-monooxygenase